MSSEPKPNRSSPAARAIARRGRELQAERRALAAMANVKVFDTQRESSESWAKHLGLPYELCAGKADWRPGGRKLRNG